MVYCPECETDLDIDEDEVDEGAVVSCPECGSDFEVITVNPIELKMVGEDEIADVDEEDEDAVKEDAEDEANSEHAMETWALAAYQADCGRSLVLRGSVGCFAGGSGPWRGARQAESIRADLRDGVGS